LWITLFSFTKHGITSLPFFVAEATLPSVASVTVATGATRAGPAGRTEPVATSMAARPAAGPSYPIYWSSLFLKETTPPISLQIFNYNLKGIS
jgi:hypothetical protein